MKLQVMHDIVTWFWECVDVCMYLGVAGCARCVHQGCQVGARDVNRIRFEAGQVLAPFVSHLSV